MFSFYDSVEKKADATYKVVSAASIIAKVTRDRSIIEYIYPEGSAVSHLDKSFGSGYPGDENCVKWIEKAVHPFFGFPNIVRFSWGTCREALSKASAHAIEWECDEEESQGGDIKSMFSFNDKSSSKRKRGGYFQRNKMMHVAPSELLK